MKKALAILALSAAVAAPASAGSMHGGDWADLIGIVVGGIATAAVAANQPPPQPVYVQPIAAPVIAQPNAVYNGWFTNLDGSVTCTYSNGTQLKAPSLSDCPAYF
jgi:hypothetical protein